MVLSTALPRAGTSTVAMLRKQQQALSSLAVSSFEAASCYPLGLGAVRVRQAAQPQHSTLDTLHQQLVVAHQAGRSFEDYGGTFLRSLQLGDWRARASMTGALPYNKILVRDLGPAQLFVISWRPGHGSPEHAHADGGCWFKVLGDQPNTAELTEIRRDTAGRISKHMWRPAAPGTAAFIHNRHGTHMVTNLTDSWVHSLHLYPTA